MGGDLQFDICRLALISEISSSLEGKFELIGAWGFVFRVVRVGRALNIRVELLECLSPLCLKHFLNLFKLGDGFLNSFLLLREALGFLQLFFLPFEVTLFPFVVLDSPVDIFRHHPPLICASLKLLEEFVALAQVK